MKIKIEKISVDVDGECLELTPEQARALRDELSKLLGDEPRITITPYVAPYWPLPDTIWWHPPASTVTSGAPGAAGDTTLSVANDAAFLPNCVGGSASWQ